jgi:malonyl CoA-acyl carrier protein transacylase
MKPEKKITETMNTTPATMPTQAAATAALARRGGSAW